MRRRQFIAVLGGAAATWPVVARGQQSSKPARIGVFVGASNPIVAPGYRAFVDEIRKLGFAEGQNLTIDQRLTSQDAAILSSQAMEMVRSNVDAIVALGSGPSLIAAVGATQNVPIVFVANNYDPIELGYVKSLASPGGNVTGIFLRQAELAEKQVDLLKETFPENSRLAILWDSISGGQFASADRRAKLLGLEVQSLKLENPPYDFELVFRGIERSEAQMLLVLSSPFFGPQSQLITNLELRHRLPAMHIFKGYTEAGGLMSYGADVVAMYRQSANYVAKILRGAKPIDLPVELPTKFEFAVNLKTAKTLGIQLPTSILLRADEVIE